MKDSSALLAEVEHFIHSLDLEHIEPPRLYRPMAYILALGGKRVRPVLTLLAYQAIEGKNPAPALGMAVALECFHNFTLMHDDIMDRAPMRRGQPAVHKVWDENTAILSGDALFALSMSLLARSFPENAGQLVANYSEMTIAVCEGQMEDMVLASTEGATLEQYLEMIRKKTAALLGCCLSLGAEAAGADEQTLAAFREIGLAIGMAFQLQDDLMDAFPPRGFGKQRGGDILENKQTFLLLKARELANAQQLNALDYWMEFQGPGIEKVKGVLAIFQALKIKEETEKAISFYTQIVRQKSAELQGLPGMPPLLEYLEALAVRKK